LSIFSQGQHKDKNNAKKILVGQMYSYKQKKKKKKPINKKLKTKT
jgi:hypothetical protein